MVILVAAASLGTGKATGQTVSPVGGGDFDLIPANAFAPFSPFPFGERNYLNWSDLPFAMNAGQTLGYNTNVLGLSKGQPLPPGTPSEGDLYSTTTVGLSTKAYVGQQQFFADGTYGVTRYRTDVADDTHQYSLDAGVDWKVTSRCSGRLVDAINDYQSPIEEQIGAGINSVNLISFNETAKCLLTGYVSAILDSGVSSTTNSNVIDAVDDFNAKFVRGGFEYALTGLDTVRALTTLTQRQFTDRNVESSIASSGLASGTTQVDYQIQYHGVFSPKLSFDGMIGLTQITDIPFLSTEPESHQTSPVYSAALTFQATPKISFALATSRSVGAPTSVVANAELNESNSASVSYQLTPKIAMQAGVARSTSTGSNSTAFSNSSSLTSNALSVYYKMSWQASPFLVANAGIQYSDRNESNSVVKDGIFTLGLTYRPR